MKRSLILSGFLFGCVHLGFAQLYVEAHGTYLLPIGGDGESSMSAEKWSSELINYGRGAGGGIVFGGQITSMLGVEGRFTYVAGAEQKTKEEFISFPFPATQTTTHTWQNNYFRIDPAVRLTAGAGSWKCYVAVGPSFAVQPKLTETSKEVETYNSETYTGNYVVDYTGGTAYGGFGALGATWSGAGAFGVFAEVEASAISWAPKKAKLEYEETVVNINGEVYSDSGTEEVRFVDTVTPDDEDKVTKVHKVMSTWGVRAGVRFVFGGGAAPHPTPAP